MKKILFCHTNFPGQFGEFGAWLATTGWDVVFATGRRDAQPPPQTRLFRFDAAAAGASETHRHARSLDRALRTAESFAAAALSARAQGVMPDVIVAHAGWGAGTYARAVWPEARFVPYVEWWYAHPRPDVHPHDPPPRDETAMRARATAMNAPLLLDLVQADEALCPSAFQASRFPDWLRGRLTVMPDGTDCAAFAPDPGARARLAALGVPDGAEVISYATRGMEPYRGFPEFMAALARLQATRPNLWAIVAGEDRVCYGEPPADGRSWLQRALHELPLDRDRLCLPGLLPPDTYRTLLQGTDVHVSLTVPFVLSWSFLDAMAAGAPLVGADVAPVREALGDSSGAVLVPLGEPEAIAGAVTTLLDDRAAATGMGLRARARVRMAYDRAWIWPARAAWLERVAASGR